MADNGAELLLQLEDFDLSQVVLIQAVIRGALVRKRLRAVKQTYEQLTAEIERNPSVGVHWHSETLCKPKVTRQTHTKTKDTEKCANSRSGKATKLKGISVETVLDNAEEIHLNSASNGAESVKSSQSDRIDLESVDDTEKEKFDDRLERINRNASPLGCQVDDDDDLLKFNSVETQTSLIEIIPSSEPKHSDPNTAGNVLEGLDTSWKDRVKPFIDNNHEKYEHASSVILNKEDELHLDLDTDRESVKSQRSKYSDKQDNDIDSQRNGSAPVRQTKAYDDDNDEKEPNDDGGDKRSRNYVLDENVSNRSERSHDRSHGSSKSGRSMSSTKREVETSKGRERNRSNHSDQSDDGMGQRSARSDQLNGGRSQRSVRSDQSDGGRSQRSVGSNQSDRSRSPRSHGSKSNHSEREKSQRSNTYGHHTEHPRPSPSSPVEFHVTRESSREDNSIKGRQLGPGQSQDSMSLTNVTSVWDSFNSIRESHEIEMPTTLPQDADKLRELRSNITMELLWVQQAINSRKNYLRLKGQM